MPVETRKASIRFSGLVDQPMTAPLPSPSTGGTVIGLAKSGNCLRHAVTASVLTQAPLTMEGGYSPMTMRIIRCDTPV